MFWKRIIFRGFLKSFLAKNPKNSRDQIYFFGFFMSWDIPGTNPDGFLGVPFHDPWRSILRPVYVYSLPWQVLWPKLLQYFRSMEEMLTVPEVNLSSYHSWLYIYALLWLSIILYQHHIRCKMFPKNYVFSNNFQMFETFTSPALAAIAWTEIDQLFLELQGRVAVN